MAVETFFSLAVLAALAVSVVLVVRGTIVKNRWGINLRRVQCPNCATVMGRVRLPASGSQAMWAATRAPLATVNSTNGAG